MELTKQDTQKAKGIAIIGMVMLHLFCRLGELPYVPLLSIHGTPLVYYLGLFGDVCVPIYCFCSGYAHHLLQEKVQSQFCKTIPARILRFLINYWIVVILFSLIGFIAGSSSTVPGTVSDFFGNFFLYRQSYNGAWWFVITYILFLLLSPLFAKAANLIPSFVFIGFSGIIYFAAYCFRFVTTIDITNPVLDWLWQQLILLGTSQFGYVFGMSCRKERWVSKLRNCLRAEGASPITHPLQAKVLRFIILLLPVMALTGHCFVQSLFVAPFTAFSVLVCLFTANLPSWLNRFLLLMGKHSTNIWLTHMFFYFTLFEDFVFIAKYPVLILVFMLIICLCVSWVINHIYNTLIKALMLNDS